MSLLLARNLRKFLEKSSAIQLSVKNQGRSDKIKENPIFHLYFLAKYGTI